MYQRPHSDTLPIGDRAVTVNSNAVSAAPECSRQQLPSSPPDNCHWRSTPCELSRLQYIKCHAAVRSGLECVRLSRLLDRRQPRGDAPIGGDIRQVEVVGVEVASSQLRDQTGSSGGGGDVDGASNGGHVEVAVGAGARRHRLRALSLKRL